MRQLSSSVVLGASVALEPLPRLESGESLHRWTERALEGVRPYHHDALLDDAWRKYQDDVHNACAPLWKLVTKRKRLADWDLYRLWTKDLARRPARRRFGRFVYVPIPWHHVVEQYGMLRRDTGPLRIVADLFRRLDFDHFDHFVTVGQSTFSQTRRYARRDGFDVPNLHRLAVVFSSRIENLDRVALRIPIDKREVAVPLLYAKRNELQPNDQPPKKDAAFFAGSCTSRIRSRLQTDLANSSAYDMSSVRPCGNKLDKPAFLDALRDHTWILAPRGSFPAAYLLAEALQAARLPVYIYAPRLQRHPPLPPATILARHLPFVDLGLDWHTSLGAVFTEPDITSIPSHLASRNATAQLAYVRQHRRLFTVDGTYRYILVKLAILANHNNPNDPSPTRASQT